MLENLPNERSKKWNLVRKIAALYRQPNTKSKDLFQNISGSLADLNIVAPAALLEWYKLTEDLTNLWDGQDSFVPPAKIGKRIGSIGFYHENQYNWEIGYLLKDAHLPDPPVYFLPFSESDNFVSPSISTFAVQMLLLETFWNGKHSFFDVVIGVEGKTIEKLLDYFKPCDLPELKLLSDRTCFYERDSVFVLLDFDDFNAASPNDFAWWAIAASDEESFWKTIKLFQDFGAEISNEEIIEILNFKEPKKVIILEK